MSELVAYRCWNLRTYRTSDPQLVELSDGQLAIPYVVLASLNNEEPWPGPVKHADEAPGKWNSNGLYTLKSPLAAFNYNRGAEVTGELAIYGKIVEHEDGYRAQHAAIRKLTMHAYRFQYRVQAAIERSTEAPTPMQQTAKMLVQLARVLERRYQCEVLIDASQKNMTDVERLVQKIQDGTVTAEDLVKIAKIFGKVT